MDVQRSVELQAIRGQSVPLTRDETVDSETQGKDEENVTDVTAADLLEDFVENSHSEVFVQVSHAQSSISRKLWVLISICSTAALFIHLGYASYNFSRFDIETKLSVKSVRKISLPAVTICNRNIENRLVAAKAENEAKAAELHDKEAEVQHMRGALDFEWDGTLGHQRQHLIVDCTYGNDSCEFNTSFYSPYFGNCYTANWNGTMQASKAGPYYGMEVLLNIEEYHYNDSYPGEIYKYKSVGAVVVVHEANQMPFPEQRGIFVSPGTAVDIKVTKTENKRLGKPYGQCVSESDDIENIYDSELEGLKYSVDTCVMTCFQLKLIHKCGCYDINLPHSNSTLMRQQKGLSPCTGNITLEQKACFRNISRHYHDVTLSCDECQDPCQETVYGHSSSSVNWPGSAYQFRLDFDLDRKYTDLIWRIAGWYPDQPRSYAMSKNLVKVNVYYDRLAVTEVTESPSYGPDRFIADVGAIFGLWIGWNLFTLFQFVELLVNLFALSMKGRRRRYNNRIPAA